MNLNKDKKLFVVWGRETALSRYLAEALGAELNQVYYKKFGEYELPAFLRYIFQGMETILLLAERRPGAVITQNPPIFLALLAWFYCRLFGAKLALDSHTAAFIDEKWVRFHGLFKFVAKRAVLNSCHNYKNLEILKSWRVEPAVVTQFYNPTYDFAALSAPLKDEKIETALSGSSFPVLMVNRFASDDDYLTVIETAKLMPEATFFISGDPTEAEVKLGELPVNVFLTGYLQHDEFLKLMSRAKVVLAFTLRPDTVLWSIREIMALGKPFVTTESEVLRHYFSEVGLFAKSQADEIKEKILEAARREEEIKRNIKIFLENDRARWEKEIEIFKKYLN